MESPDEKPQFSEEFVEQSILELLKDRVNQGPTLSKALWAKLKENSSLRLLEFETVIGRTRYLAGKGWVRWQPVTSGMGVVEHFAAWITAAGEDELRRRAKEKAAGQPVEVATQALPQRPQPKKSGAEGPRYAYLHSLQIAGFTCFESAQLDFQYPGRRAADTEQLESSAGLDNLNLIVGDNGSGKTSVLKAIALTILGGVLPHEGFRSTWQVRRSKLSANLNAQLQTSDGLEQLAQSILNKGPESEILGKWSSSKSTPDGEPSDIWFQNGPEYFLCGYGVNSRRAESDENYDKGLRDKARGFRYQRVAGLFEEGYSLKPISTLFADLQAGNRGLSPAHLEEARGIVNQLLEPTEVKWDGQITGRSMAFRLPDGLEVPVQHLSDGFRSFLAFVGDLLTNLCEVATGPLREVAGIVLVDELDQHLHPKWQRSVLSSLAETLPKIQFVLTSHSPILVGCLPPENIYVSEREPNGQITVRKADVDFQGKKIDEILLSSYFGLRSTLSPEMTEKRDREMRERIQIAHQYLQERTPELAQQYLEKLGMVMVDKE